MNRRDFTNVVLGGSLIAWLASALYPLVKYLKPPRVAEAAPNSVNAGKEADFPKNTGKIVKFGRTPVILVRAADGDFHALSATCTHLQCIVQYRPDLHEIWCACHNGIYDLNGRNVSGPPPKPLTPYAVNVVKGDIMVSKVS